MKKNESVTSIMSEDVKTVHLGQKLSEARKILNEFSIHHLPVVSGGKLVGILSSTDMMELSFGAYGTDSRSLDAILDHQFTLEEIMKKEVTSIKAKQTIRDAASILSEGKFHSLPVVDDKGHLKGIVTSTDLIRYLFKQY